MKTPEQLAAEINECAESIIRNLREDIAPELREDTWVWTAACHAKVIKEDIAALTEHAKGLEEKAHGFKLCFPYETIGNMNPALFKDGGYHYYVPEAELTALRAVADEMEAALKDFEGMMSESIGIAGYHLNGDVFGWDEGDDPLRDKTCSALTRYADLKKENN